MNKKKSYFGKVGDFFKRLPLVLRILMIFFLAGSIIFSIWGIVWWGAYVFGKKFEFGGISDFPDLGDFMGGTAGAMGTLAALIYFMYSVDLQQKELQAQRRDIRDTKLNQKIHQFEVTYFNYLHLLQGVIGSFKHGEEIGACCFECFAGVLEADLKMKKSEKVDENAVCDFFRKREEDLCYYFSNVNQVLALLRFASNFVKDRVMLSNYYALLEAQLTQSAKELLYLYARYYDGRVFGVEVLSNDFVLAMERVINSLLSRDDKRYIKALKELTGKRVFNLGCSSKS